ncbi:MAG: glycosyltransferase family 2 protein [Leptolyngbyaceae cyanobacterium]
MTATLPPRQTISALEPSVTIVVTPQERFSYTQKSLESIYRHTRIPFTLIYIDAGSPKHIHKYLVKASARLGFTLLRTNHFLSPNQARNLGLAQATTDYVVFIDNDIHISSGWLENLLHCAKETNAAVVCPLSCVGKPLHDRIHLAGGEARIFMDIKDGQIRRRIHEKRFLTQRSAATIKHQLYRRSCELVELRCALVKRDIFTQIGPLDEKLLGSQEDIDFSLSVNQVGGLMFCEPTSVVTYVLQTSYSWSDLAYFMLRWSDTWEVESLMHFQQKWDLDVDQYFLERYKQVGYRRRQVFIYPLLHQLTGNNHISWLEKLVVSLEKWFSHLLTDRFTRLANKPITKLSSGPTVYTGSTKKKLRQSVLQSYNAPA